MDFFEHQDRARRNTWKLVVLFFIGITATLALINIVCFLGYWFFIEPQEVTRQLPATELPSLLKQLLPVDSVELVSRQSGFSYAWHAWWGSNLNWQINVGVISAVVIGTLFRFLELAGGGRKVAEWAGARPVDLGTSHPDHKQLINVCEEMAIAAGMPVPDLYVMHREHGINAFVAGRSSDDTVLVVTQGALDRLSRDELQGVIGHEYSHILNGDMRLNVRLMAFLAGLVMIGQIGRFLLHSSISTRSSYSSRKSRYNLITALFGLALVGIGYIGVLVGRMIKAAVSRQREYLADASSVQFTRNPDGLAGALYRIHESEMGSMLNHRHAEDMSHFCFGESVALSERLATHPPVLSRIRRISPNFIPRARAKARKEKSEGKNVQHSIVPSFETAVMAAGIASLAGTVKPEHVAYTHELYRHIPQHIRDWVHQSLAAKAYVYGQTVLGSKSQKQAMVNLLKEEDSASVAMMEKMWKDLQQMDGQLRVPVLELAIPTLKRLPEVERVVFLDRVERLIKLDGRVDFIEWVIFSLLQRRFGSGNKMNDKLASDIGPFKTSLEWLFRAFRSINPSPQQADSAYQTVCRSFAIRPSALNNDRTLEFTPIYQALTHLAEISFTWRKMVLQGCADIVQSNGRIAHKEYEALRVVAECLECPLPILMVEPSTADPRDEPIPFV